MKQVDVLPQMLKDLPFHSLFWAGTEGVKEPITCTSACILVILQ